MKFGRIPVEQAEGAVLAHSVRAGGRAYKKGRVLSQEDVTALANAGLDNVVAARLEAGDIDEDTAAAAVANVAAGRHTRVSTAFTGRVNLFAECRGVVVVNENRLDRLNLVDESVTLATLPPFGLVEPKQMVATIKVIPLAVPQPIVDVCCAIASEGGPLIHVAELKSKRIGLIQTRTEGFKESVLDKTVRVTRDRLEPLGSSLVSELRCDHDEHEVADCIGRLEAAGCDVILIAGASAIVDRRDVVPSSIEAVGGVVEHFGMPVDPGNLILLARHGDISVVGLPGCARSPKLNGFDWVLHRLLADTPVKPDHIMRMGAGGLLTEISSRPLPRAAATKDADEATVSGRAPRVAALVLAAGQSRRMGSVNKLLATVADKPMVVNVVEAVTAAKVDPVIVVTGHEAARVRKALAGQDVTLVENPDYAQGLSTSLHRGIAALPPDVDGVLVCLADMPMVTPAHIDRLIAAFNPLEGRAICVPTFKGKRGNPVLWARRFFEEMGSISGDVGAKHLIGAYEELLAEVSMGDAGVLVDVDTPRALAELTPAREA